MSEQKNKNSSPIKVPIKGLFTDTSYINQPENTYTFALNAVNESNEGDFQSLSNENSNVIFTQIKQDFIILGSVYIGDGETLIFSVKDDNSESEIGIVYENKQVKYETLVNDKKSLKRQKLNFRGDKQIQAVYRLRRGCEKNIYWTDNYNKPRRVNLSNLNNYKDDQDRFVSKRFDLIKTSDKIPIFKEVVVKNGGGSLPPGKIGILVQYSDGEKNYTKFLSEYSYITIYKDSLKDPFFNINGSINVENDQFKEGYTNKSIEVHLDNLDKDFIFYRLAFIIFENATNTISNVYYTELIPTKVTTFVYDGTNHKEKGTVAEVKLFNEALDISKAKTIEISSDRLVLGHIEENNYRFEKLQKYASKINTDCVVKTIDLSSVAEKHNNKNPLHDIYGTGFQAGEVYSLGIIYLFGDIESPVFHIPGKNKKDEGIIYNKETSEIEEYFPMSIKNNTNENLTYLQRESCHNFDYWGIDSTGESLKDKSVRFHRFPERSEIDKPLIANVEQKQNKNFYTQSTVKIEGNGITAQDCVECSKKLAENDDEQLKKYFSKYCIKYQEESKEVVINKPMYIRYKDNFSEDKYNIIDIKHNVRRNSEISQLPLEDYFISNVEIIYIRAYQIKKEYYLDEALEKTTYESYPFGLEINEENKSLKANVVSLGPAKEYNEGQYKIKEYVECVLTTEQITLKEEKNINNTIIMSHDNRSFKVSYIISTQIDENGVKKYYGNILGLSFSNIELPGEEEFGVPCTGYYIVAQKREKIDKTIMGSGYAFPIWQSTTNNKYNSIAFYEAEFGKNHLESSKTNIKTNPYGFFLDSPEYYFNSELFEDFSEIETQGYIKNANNQYSGIQIQDIHINDKRTTSSAKGVDDLPGIINDHDGEEGMSLRVPVKNTEVSYSAEKINFNVTNEQGVDVYNLGPISYNTFNENKYIFNLNALKSHLVFINRDEKIKIAEIFENKKSKFDFKYPYVYIRKNHNHFYQNYQNRPYYKLNVEPANSITFNTYKGDCKIVSMRPSMLVYHNIKMALRIKEYSFWRGLKVLGAFLSAVILTVVTWGAGAGIGAIIITGALGLLGTVFYGIYQQVLLDKFNEIYNKHWELGLKESVNDDLTDTAFLHNIARPTGTYNAGWLGIFGAGTDHSNIPKNSVSELGIFSATGFQDDMICWYGQSIGDLFYESTINTDLRLMPLADRNNYQKPFKYIENRIDKLDGRGLTDQFDLRIKDSFMSSNVALRYVSNIFGNRQDPVYYYFRDELEKVEIETDLEQYFKSKLVKPYLEYENKYNVKGETGYNYLVLPTQEIFFRNRDYDTSEKIKGYYNIPLEYAMCSKCKEYYPNRIYWSDKSFSESLIDNFSLFKANNYKNVSGEYGKITNIFTLNNDLYIHTEEGLWVQKVNYQERVQNDIVTYIGTGDFGSLPAQLITNDKSGGSAGLQHREAQVLTPYGYFFINEKEGKIYHFNGKLQDISNTGMSKWFNENIPLTLNRIYKENTGEDYKYNDNPSNFLGTGFIITYDKERERILITKRDYIPNQYFTENKGYEICLLSKDVKIFFDINKTKSIMESKLIEEKTALLNTATRFTDSNGVELSVDERPTFENDFSFVEVENCEMKFETYIKVQKEVSTGIKEVVSNNTIIVSFYDESSMINSAVTNLQNTLKEWFVEFKASYNNGDNNITFIDSKEAWKVDWESEDWLIDAQTKVLQEIGDGKEVILLLFVDETAPNFHSHTFNSNKITEPTPLYKKSVNTFVNELYPRFKSLICINYPIVRSDQECYEYLQHTIASIEAKDMTLEEVNALKKNPIIPDDIWERIKANLQNNPYKDLPRLKDYGFIYKENRSTRENENVSENCPAEQGKVISPCIFTEDIQFLLKEVNKNKTLVLNELKKIYVYLPGEILPNENIINNSWTMSYSLKYNSWISYHSYLPNFYFRMNNKHYSWLNGNNNIYLHNRPNHYQEFYEDYYPYIVEYVSNDNPIVTKVFEHIQFLTEAYKYDKESQEYYNDRFETFNRAVLYNTRQCSGELHLRVKDTTPLQKDYLEKQVLNEENNVIFLDRNEKDWFFNNFRDYRIDYNKPIWSKDKITINRENDSKFIDKVLNTDTIDFNKDWYNLESFRDKFMVVRLFFDNNYYNVKLIFNFTTENKTISNY